MDNIFVFNKVFPVIPIWEELFKLDSSFFFISSSQSYRNNFRPNIRGRFFKVPRNAFLLDLVYSTKAFFLFYSEKKMSFIFFPTSIVFFVGILPKKNKRRQIHNSYNGCIS